MHQATYRPILGVSNGDRLGLEVWHTPSDSLTGQQRTLLLALRRRGTTALALPLSSAVIGGIIVDFFLQCCRERPLLILWQPEREIALARRQRALDVLNQLAQAGVLVIADGWTGAPGDDHRVSAVPGLWGARLAAHLLPGARRRTGAPDLFEALDSARGHGLQTIVSEATVEDLPLLQHLGVDWSCPPAAALPATESPAAVAA